MFYSYKNEILFTEYTGREYATAIAGLLNRADASRRVLGHGKPGLSYGGLKIVERVDEVIYRDGAVSGAAVLDNSDPREWRSWSLAVCRAARPLND